MPLPILTLQLPFNFDAVGWATILKLHFGLNWLLEYLGEKGW